MKLYFIFFISICRIIDNSFVFNRELTNFIWKILECDIFKNETLNEKNYVFCIYFYIIHFFRLTFDVESTYSRLYYDFGDTLYKNLEWALFIKLQVIKSCVLIIRRSKIKKKWENSISVISLILSKINLKCLISIIITK